MGGGVIVNQLRDQFIKTLNIFAMKEIGSWNYMLYKTNEFRNHKPSTRNIISMHI